MGSKYIIRGGNKLKGTIKVSGAKNSALKLMAAALLTEERTILFNVPLISDVNTMAAVMNRLGVKVDYTEPDIVEINPSNKLIPEAPYELVNQMRASIIVLGPLLARLGKARVAMPGGCNIGSRKIDMHIRGLEQLGARFEVGHGYIEAVCEKLMGAKISLEFPSVGATENLLMAATLAEGVTVIKNAAREPEITNLADFLVAMGAKIEGAGSSVIRINGVDRLHGVEFKVVPDRIEAGTFIVAAAITGGDVIIEGIIPSHLNFVIGRLQDIGVKAVVSNDNWVRVTGCDGIRATDIATLPYPGFPTDMQTQIMAMLALADGTSVITENIFENRFMFVNELNRMGGKVKIEGRHAIINGVKKLNGTSVKCPDLRGGAALVVAGLVADGITEVQDVYHIDRGYHNFEYKLRLLGADIERIKNDERAAVFKTAR